MRLSKTHTGKVVLVIADEIEGAEFDQRAQHFATAIGLQVVHKIDGICEKLR
jgi:hypothetical protein